MTKEGEGGGEIAVTERLKERERERIAKEKIPLTQYRKQYKK